MDSLELSSGLFLMLRDDEVGDIMKTIAADYECEDEPEPPPTNLSKRRLGVLLASAEDLPRWINRENMMNVLARVLAGRPVMVSVIARTAHTSRSWASAVVAIWRTVGESLPSTVLRFRSYSDEGLDDRMPPKPSAADPLSAEISPAVPATQTFGARRPVYDRNGYPPRKCGWFRVYRPIAKLSPTALTEEERPVRNLTRASRNLAVRSCHNSPREGFDGGNELPIGSACGRGNIHLPSASTTREAIAILRHHRQQGLSVDSYMFVEILKRCSMQKDLVSTRQVHDYIIQSGMQKQSHVVTTLLSVYIKCGRLQDARRVFDGLEKTNRTVVTWNVMIGAYAKSGSGMEAYGLFHQMKREGFVPDAFTYASILNPSASAGALEWVKEVHGHIRRAGLESDLRVGSALVHMYAQSGSIDDARLVFDRMDKRNVFTWTKMIGAYAESGCGMEAYRLFLQMKRQGFEPNAITYLSILNASASVGALEWVEEIHSHVFKEGLESDLRVANALVHMYAKSGSIDDARLVFERMEERDVVTWTAMIGGLAQHGCGQEALKLFRKMIADGVKPKEATFVALLSACSHAGLVDDGRRLFLAMKQDYGVVATVVHYTCMVDLLGRAGHLEEAKVLIDNMPVKPDGVIWKALLGACRTHCNVELGELAAKEVFKLEPKDSAAYVLLSNIYAARGQWENVISVRKMMQKRGVRKEPGRSWIEVDNKIHEFVVGDTSHPEAKAIYTELNKLTEMLKAKGYIPDTQLVLQNIDEEDKELAFCLHSEKLAIAYGLLRLPHGKPIRVEKNLRVCSDCHAATKLISGLTGREIIVRDSNRFHHFKDGVCSCGDYW